MVDRAGLTLNWVQILHLLSKKNGFPGIVLKGSNPSGPAITRADLYCGSLLRESEERTERKADGLQLFRHTPSFKGQLVEASEISSTTVES